MDIPYDRQAYLNESAFGVSEQTLTVGVAIGGGLAGYFLRHRIRDFYNQYDGLWTVTGAVLAVCLFKCARRSR